MELLDTTIVNVALNQISGALGATIEDIAWVITSYAIANVVIIPMTGFLGEYFGRKNYYLGSMILFGIASYFCGMSETLWELVFWRFIQGIGGGASYLRRKPFYSMHLNRKIALWPLVSLEWVSS